MFDLFHSSKTYSILFKSELIGCQSKKTVEVQQTLELSFPIDKWTIKR